MKASELFGAILLIGMLLFVLLTASTPPTQRMESQITVHGAVSQLWLNTTTLDWGIVQAGVLLHRSLLINNTSAKPVTVSMTATNWLPEACRIYISFMYDPINASLTPFVPVAYTLMLTVSPRIGNITDFSFNLEVYAK